MCIRDSVEADPRHFHRVEWQQHDQAHGGETDERTEHHYDAVERVHVVPPCHPVSYTHLGISMGEQGISQCISLRLDEAVQAAGKDDHELAAAGS